MEGLNQIKRKEKKGGGVERRALEREIGGRNKDAIEREREKEEGVYLEKVE